VQQKVNSQIKVVSLYAATKVYSSSFAYFSVGPMTIQRILAVLYKEGLSCLEVYQWKSFDFRQRGFSEKISQTLVEGLSDQSRLEREVNLIEAHGLSLLTYEDKNYPEFLRHIYLPPPILYVRGSLAGLFEKSLAIVGARRGDHYAREVVHSIVPSLVENGWTIVSGGAFGVDAMAHQCALECLGKTVVVLGSGLLRPYPHQHKALFEHVCNKNGALVSPFPLEQEPTRGNFPARNRIIAGVAKGVVVVQAARRSGALITAQFGLDQGKEIFAVPGNVMSDLSDGCNKLLKDGAHVMTTAQDIFDVFGEKVDSKPITKDLFNGDGLKQKIYNQCQNGVSVDDIVDVTGISVDQAYEYLFALQVEGHIEQNFLGLFQCRTSRSF